MFRVASERGGLGFIVGGTGNRAGEGVDAQWEKTAGLEPASADAGGFEGIEAAGDVGTQHPKGKALEGCAAFFGDGGEALVRIREVLEDVGGGIGGRVEDRAIGSGVGVLGGEAEGIGRSLGVG